MIKNTMSSIKNLSALFVLFSVCFSFASPITAQESPSAGVSATVDEHGAGAITLTAKGTLPKPPLFFTADVHPIASITAKAITQQITLNLKVHQGRPELLTLEVKGEGEITLVTGGGLTDWAVRTSADGTQRFLDLKPTLTKGKPSPRELNLVILTKFEIKSLPTSAKLLTLNPGKAVGFSSKLILVHPGIDARISSLSGLLPLEKDWQFSAAGEHTLTLQLYPSGAAPEAVELRGARLIGSFDEKLKSARLTLTATAHVTDPDGGKIDFLNGQAAISNIQTDADYSLQLVTKNNTTHYQMVFDRAGSFPVQLEIIAKINDKHPKWPGWNVVDFTAPQGAVVPLQFTGLGASVLFSETQPVLLRTLNNTWRGFLPASGHCLIAWKKGRKAGDGKLAFTSNGLSDITVGAGLMRQTENIRLKILQGKLNELTLRMQGPGEVLDVEGTHIAGWSVEKGTQGNDRLLKVRLSLPLDNVGVLKIHSQQALKPFPITATPLQLTPIGVLRHSGHVRLSNAGAVRLETAEVKGMMQLSPDQFPGQISKKNKARQEFVFRYPSADYAWKVRADQILPEVSLNQVVVYQQTESDRVIHASIELDIREAALREWELRVPDGYAVASLSGAEVADYVVGTKPENGLRDIKVLFKKAVSGRQLIKIRLEKNAPPVAGSWVLPVLEFPGAKSVRGHLGIAAAAGWRVVPGKLTKLTETPLSYFPLKDPDLQQSYRLREIGWSAEMIIEAREQSVQADVFHLYSLKEGMAYGSVLLNYFVVGAPVNQWELSIPRSYGNVNIEGLNVRQWRRVDDEKSDKVIVQLEQPISGPATLLVTYENAMSARGGKLALGEVRPLNVQSESGFIEVVSPVLLKHTIAKTSPGLLKISAQELPAEFRMLTTAPAQAAWQYAARPFDLAIDITWFHPGKTLEQVVDFAKLSTTVSRDGQVKTEAEFYVRTRGRQPMRMTLPAGSKLWEARADGKIITARLDGDQYLLPLPVGDDPNKPVKVTIRYGGHGAEAAGSKSGRKVKIGAPVLTAPLIIAGWEVRGERGMMLVPADNDSGVRRLPLTETGFESFRGRGISLAVIAALFLGGVFFLRRPKPTGTNLVLGNLWLVLVIGLSISMALTIWSERRINLAHLEITAQVVSPDSPVSVVLENVTPWQAMVSGLGIAASVVGVIVLLASFIIRKIDIFPVRVLAIAAIIAGILAQCGGGAGLMGLVAALAAVLLVSSLIHTFKFWSRWNTARKEQRRIDDKETAEALSLGSSDSAAHSIVPLLVIGLSIAGMMFGGDLQAKSIVKAPQNQEVHAVDSMVQTWKIEKERLLATIDISLNAKEGTSYLLLQEPAVLTSFTGEGLRVSKIKKDGKNVWMLAVDTSGAHTATTTYEMAMPEKRANFILPTGPASVQKITAEIKEPGLELFSHAAVQTLRNVGGTGAVELVLAPLPQIVIGVRPRGRDISAEQTKFYAEIANLYLPSPGVVDGIHRVSIRPSSGKVDHLVLTVPAGFTVGEVTGDPVGNWRFDPATRKLSVDIQPAQSKLFKINIQTQRGLSALPAEVNLATLTIADDAGETNMLGLAFGTEAQPGKITVEKLSVVNVDDFDASLIPLTSQGGKARPRGILHKVYRSASGAGSLTLQVAPVMPEVRVVSSQELTLGSERILLSAVLNANITRSGIFKLSFKVPDGMEVESLTGSSLSHWTESVNEEEDKQRTVTLHLNGRTLGMQKFALSLTGPPAKIGSQGEWLVPRLLLNEAVRQSGQLIVMPEKGIRVRAIKRNNVSRLNAQSNQTINARVKESGGLAFRILQSDWSLTLGIEKLEAWITASVLHEVTLREGQTRTRLSAIYQIEHASVKSIRINLPGLSPEEARTVRASGAAVKGITQLDEKGGLWEIQFRRGILGSVPVQIEYQRSADRQKKVSEQIQPAIFPQTKRLAYFMAIRTTGRLDMQPGKPARGWRRADWSAVSSKLRNPADTSMPDLCYRLSEPEGALTVSLKRHQMADTLKLRVSGGNMMTIFSPIGESLTSVSLSARVLEKTTLRITLPENAQLYNVRVNDASVTVVREGDTHLFHVSPRSFDNDEADISLVYSSLSDGKDIQLAAPSFNVPIESLTWDVLVPEGYKLDGHTGGFEMRGSQGVVDYNLEDYLALINRQRSQEAQQGVVSLQKASDYMRAGKRKEAAKELEKVTKNRSVDAASNEDARVQLFQLQCQQATWGLNTRRQRIYLDNKAAGNGVVANAALEDSAYNNPMFQGKKDFDVRQVDDFLRGNTLEEKKSLKNIAKRLIGQQLATEPAPQTISTIVRGRGEVLRFTRGIQVDGGGPLGLQLDIESTTAPSLAWSFITLLALGFISATAIKIWSGDF